MDLEHESRLTAVEERSKSNTHRIDKLEGTTEAINRLATSMEVMAERQEQCVTSVGSLDSKVSTLDGKVTALEQKPAKRWDGMVDKAISALIGGLIAYMLAQLGIF